MKRSKYGSPYLSIYIWNYQISSNRCSLPSITCTIIFHIKSPSSKYFYFPSFHYFFLSPDPFHIPPPLFATLLSSFNVLLPPSSLFPPPLSLPPPPLSLYLYPLSLPQVTCIWEYDKRSVNGANFVYYGMFLKGVEGEREKALVAYAKEVKKNILSQLKNPLCIFS